MNLRTLIAGKRSDQPPARVTFAGDHADGMTLPEALQATEDAPLPAPTDPRVRAALAAVIAQVAVEQATGQRIDPEPAPEPLPAAGPPPPSPFSGVSRIMVGQVTYPEPCERAQDYAGVLRQIGAATGTSSPYEHDAAWPRPALEVAANPEGIRL